MDSLYKLCLKPLITSSSPRKPTKSIMTSFPTPFFLNTPSSSSALVVKREEFNAFHKIDRTLFTRLVFSLNRDMNQSFQVIAFLMLLEQNGYARTLISYLVSLPDAFLDAVANEIGVCLTFLYNQDFLSTFLAANNYDDNSIIPFMILMTGGRLTLRLIHQNREIFCFGLTKNMTDVCSRAFEDILVRAEMYNREKLMAIEREMLIEETRRLSVQQESTNRLSVQQETIPPPPPPPSPPAAPATPVEEETKKEVNEEAEIVADDRTVFLTFSKGYLISEEEVRVFFTRKFGEVIESIEMQEVEENEQPLFAKMVLKTHCVSKMEEIVSAGSRNKYTINGKHVWARKYVRRNPKYPASSSTHI